MAANPLVIHLRQIAQARYPFLSPQRKLLLHHAHCLRIVVPKEAHNGVTLSKHRDYLVPQNARQRKPPGNLQRSGDRKAWGFHASNVLIRSRTTKFHPGSRLHRFDLCPGDSGWISRWVGSTSHNPQLWSKTLLSVSASIAKDDPQYGQITSMSSIKFISVDFQDKPTPASDVCKRQGVCLQTQNQTCSVRLFASLHRFSSE